MKTLLISLGTVWMSFGSAVLGQEKPVSIDSLQKISDDSEVAFAAYNYQEAIELSARLLDEAAKIPSPYHSFLGYDMMGTVYLELQDTLQAEVNYNKAHEIAIQTASDSLLAWSYTNLGNIYSERKETVQKGIDYYKKSIELNEKFGYQEENIIPFVNIGWTYLDQEKYDEAYPFLIRAKSILEKDSLDVLGNVELKTLIGRYYIEKEKYALAEELLLEAKELVESQDYIIEGAEVHKHLTVLYEEQGNIQQAFESLKQEKYYTNRRYAVERVAQTQIASARFNLEQYERDLASARMEQAYNEKIIFKSKQIQTVLIIASLMLLVALGLLYVLLKSRKRYICKLRQKNRQLVLAKNRAEELSQLKTQFFSTVSHEIRTPLYGVIGIASILLEDKGSSAHRDDLKSLKFSADYLLALINDVLLLNKMDANGVVLEHTPFKLSSLLKSILKSFEFLLEQNKNEIHLHIDPSIPNRLVGDSVRLSQILMNLIGNAIKFNENGNIWVDINLVEQTGENTYKAQFIVKDDGIGIPKEKHESIFEQFTQVENNNYNYQGTGLGLPIVKKLLRLHHSDISLDSAIGEGATFSFVLELEADKRIAVSNDGVHQEDGNVTASDTHILVVDDNRINQKITQKILESRNFTCSLADDGAEAIALTRKNNYDLILMDIHMPNVDGIEATKAIRKFNAHIPIIALTAVEIDEIRKSILEAGMNDIILKPYDVSRFNTIILRNLNKKVY